jgi:peptidoglycan hydrolase-like protein with peptidoglycan-binding domain
VSAATEAPAPAHEATRGRSHRRLRRRAGRALAVVVVLGAGGAAVWLLLPGESAAPPAANDRVPLGTATVQRRDLVDRRDVDATLGYADDRTLAAPAGGTVTRLRAEGAVVGRGRSLLSLDARATAWVLYGTRPFYRDLGPGMSDGRDVRQLERNLVALGYDPGTVDADWTWATTAAVEAFQEDRGLDETGTLKRTDLVVSDGPARVGAHKLEVGDEARLGAPVTALSATVPEVTAQIPAGDAGAVRRGAAVTVTLADGRTARGKVSKIASVATAGQDGAEATVGMSVALRDDRRGGLDGAPVTLSLATGSTAAALAVPISALVATGPSAYAVQLAGTGRLVAVTLGVSADGWVQVAGRLAAGARVVVPR